MVFELILLSGVGMGLYALQKHYRWKRFRLESRPEVFYSKAHLIGRLRSELTAAPADDADIIRLKDEMTRLFRLDGSVDRAYLVELKNLTHSGTTGLLCIRSRNDDSTDLECSATVAKNRNGSAADFVEIVVIDEEIEAALRPVVLPFYDSSTPRF